MFSKPCKTDSVFSRVIMWVHPFAPASGLPVPTQWCRYLIASRRVGTSMS